MMTDPILLEAHTWHSKTEDFWKSFAKITVSGGFYAHSYVKIQDTDDSKHGAKVTYMIKREKNLNK